jgi:hypothetical protein
MNALICYSPFFCVAAMSILLCFSNSITTKIILFSIIGINILTTIYHLYLDNSKKSLELRIYTDNIIILLLIVCYPEKLFFGYFIQVLLSILVTHLYLKDKVRIYKALMFLIFSEVIIYLPLCSLKFSCNFVFNTLCMLLLIIFLLVTKNKFLLSPEKKYKKIILDTNNLVRHQIIECITPMLYYVRDLDNQTKEKMEILVTRLRYLAQDNSINFGHMISIIKTTLITVSKHKFNITLVDQTNKPIDMDSYTLLVILYVIFESSVANSSTEIVVKFNNNKITITDNGIGFDTKLKSFLNSKLHIAIELLELYDIPVNFSTTQGVGTTITLTLD